MSTSNGTWSSQDIGVVLSTYVMRSLGVPNFVVTRKQVWNYTIMHGRFVLEHLKRMDHLDQAGYNVHTAMTAILPRAQAVYTGDEDGKVVSLSLSLYNVKTMQG